MAQEDLLTAGELSELFGVSRQTVRQWSIEFAEYLSPTANPGPNRTRNYTQDDLSVIALVAAMKAHGRFYHDIHSALSNGMRGEVPSLEFIQRRNRFEEQIAKLQSATERELALANQRVEQAQAQVEYLQHEVHRVETDRDYWRAQATNAQEKLETVSGELHSAQVESARLSGELEGLKRERDGLATVDQRYQAQLQRLEAQAERLQTRIDSLEDERARLTQELMSLYRRLAAEPGADARSTSGDGKPHAPESR